MWLFYVPDFDVKKDFNNNTWAPQTETSVQE